ncbi:MAG: hypothetical protein WAX69_15380 [Victivallales bacterium]
MQNLKNILDSIDKSSRNLHFADGSCLLMLPGSGRVLGLFTPDSEENFFWTNPALNDKKRASSFFKAKGWHNPGGDRTWLAPEIEIFIGDLANPTGTYQVPRGLDPGSWRIECHDPFLRLANKSPIHMRRSKQKLNVRIFKEFKPAPNPLRNMNIKGLQYSGYEQNTSLEMDVVPSSPVQIGLWNLLQLPKPGRMLIPTYFKAKPQLVFGPAKSADFKIGRNLIIWNMDHGKSSCKMSIKAEALTGRAGYLCRSSGKSTNWNLVVRQFSVNPSSEYVDALWSDPSDTGYAFQACSVNSGKQSFNELEYHAPAATTLAGHNQTRDQSLVWAFRGGFADIEKAVRIILGLKFSTL